MAHLSPCAGAAASLRPLPPVIVHIIERIDATARHCQRTLAAGAHADPAAFAEAQLLLPELAATRAEMLRFHEINDAITAQVSGHKAQAKKAQQAQKAGGAQ